MAQSALWLPEFNYGTTASSGWNSSLLIDATGEKIAMMGRMWNADGATKSIRKVHFPFGTVVKAGGSGLTVSLQDISLTAGPPMQPDGTQDQTVAIANGDAGFASNTWYTTAAFSADRSVAFGELLAVVIEFDGSGRLGSDSAIVRGANSGQYRQLVSGLYTGSWAAITAVPSILFEFSDGTFGAFDHGMPISAPVTQQSYNNASTPDEYALKFRVPFNASCDGAWVYAYGNTGDFDVVLYEGTTALATVTNDANASASAFNSALYVSFPAQSLVTGTDYYLSAKPTSATSISAHTIDVANASYWVAFPGGTDFKFASRTDGGAWSETATRRLYAGLRLYPSGGGGGGGIKLAGRGGLAG